MPQTTSKSGHLAPIKPSCGSIQFVRFVDVANECLLIPCWTDLREIPAMVVAEDPVFVSSRVQPLRIASPTPVVQCEDAHMIDSVVVVVAGSEVPILDRGLYREGGVRETGLERAAGPELPTFQRLRQIDDCCLADRSTDQSPGSADDRLGDRDSLVLGVVERLHPPLAVLGVYGKEGAGAPTRRWLEGQHNDRRVTRGDRPPRRHETCPV